MFQIKSSPGMSEESFLFNTDEMKNGEFLWFMVNVSVI